MSKYNERFDEKGKLTEYAHEEDHKLFNEERERKAKVADKIDKIKTNIISTVLVAMALGFASFIWDVITVYFKGPIK